MGQARQKPKTTFADKAKLLNAIAAIITAIAVLIGAVTGLIIALKPPKLPGTGISGCSVLVTGQHRLIGGDSPFQHLDLLLSYVFPVTAVFPFADMHLAGFGRFELLAKRL